MLTIVEKFIRKIAKINLRLLTRYYKINAISLMEKEIMNYYENNRRLSKKTNSLSFYTTVTGDYYLPTHAYEDIIALAIINNQIFDKEIVELATKFIKPDTAVLDIGANFGQMSILFSNLVGEKGKVYSFDADDWIFEILQKNIQANKKADKIKPYFGAVYNEDQQILFFPDQDFEQYGTYGSYGIDINAQSGRKVKTLTIDNLNIEDRISFIKIDVQGSDLKAMQGAIKTIKKNKCPVVFEYEYNLEEKNNMLFQDYVEFVESIGYRFSKVINGYNYLILPK